MNNDSKFKKGDLVEIEAGFYGVKTATIGIVIGYDPNRDRKLGPWIVYNPVISETVLYTSDEFRKLSK